MRVTEKLLAATAAVGLLLAQPVVAATRSADALPAQTAVGSVERVASPVTNVQRAGQKVPVAFIIATFGALAFAIIALIDKNNDGLVDSPG